MTGAAAARPANEDRSINFRVHTLASSLFKGAMQYYVAQFGVGLPEMRVLSNLGREGPLAAHQIVALTAMDKALVSRVLTALSRRGYVSSSSPKTDPRRRTWALTRAGRELVKQLRPVWKRREAIIQAGLSEAELKVLADLLDRMFAASEKLRAEEAIALRAARQSAIAGRKSTEAGQVSLSQAVDMTGPRLRRTRIHGVGRLSGV